LCFYFINSFLTNGLAWNPQLKISSITNGKTTSRSNVLEPAEFLPTKSYRLKCRVISMPTNLFSMEGKNCQKMEANFQRSESHAANLDLT